MPNVNVTLGPDMCTKPLPKAPTLFVRMDAVSGVASKLGSGVMDVSSLRVLTADTFLATSGFGTLTWLNVSTHRQLRTCVQHFSHLGCGADKGSALCVLVPAHFTASIQPAKFRLRRCHTFTEGSKLFIDGAATVLPALHKPMELWTDSTAQARLNSASSAENPSMVFQGVNNGASSDSILFDTGATRC